MKALLVFLFFVSSASLTGQAQTCTGSVTLMKHVYNPDRLQESKGCITVTGVIVKKTKERDGDFHVRLKLDPGQGPDLINAKNKSKQGGALVFEPICVTKVTQKSAKAACKGFHQVIFSAE